MNRLAIAALSLLALAPATLFAQATSASLSGRVTDPSAASVPDAQISAANLETGLKRETRTNEQGNYSVPLLPPGSYRVTVTKQGFRPISRSGITLAVDQAARIDFVLEVGAVTETVEVTAAVPLLDQETSALGQVIDNSKVVNIPLNGRSPFRLVQLTTNVMTAPSANGQFGDIPVNTMDDSIISINGGRAKTNEVLIDGIPSTTGVANQMTTIPSVDSTQEFKVQSNNLSAEWGRFGGGVINVSTRAGTNALHGSMFEFLRNSKLDANEFFNKRAGRATPPFRMNQFGFAVGGPVSLPKLYSGKDRTFFFADYQGTKWVRGDTFLTSVPTDLQRRGDYTQTFNQRGQRIIAYDPNSSRANPAVAGAFIRDAFPGNVLPAARIDPIGRKLVEYYPQANTAGDPIIGTNNYASNAPRRIDQANFGARIDHNLSSSYRMFGRFSVNRSTLAQPDNFGNVATPGVGANGKLRLYNYSAALDNTVTVSPTAVLNARYGFARFFWARPTRSYGFSQKELGFPDSYVSQITEPLFPIVSVEGLSGLGGGSLLRTGQDTHSLLVSLTKLAGRHNFKAGFDGRLRRNNLFNLANGGGTFGFTRAMTRGPNPNVFAEDSGIGLASLLLGAASSGSINIAAGNSLQNMYMAGFVQDDIRINPRFTLNVGLRYEMETPVTERRNQMNWFDMGVASPVANSAFPSLLGALAFAGASGTARQVYDYDNNNIAPRFGFAWTAAKRTVVRGGAGIFFNAFGLTQSDTGFVPGAGYSSTTPMVATLDSITPFRTLSNPFPEGLVQPTRDSQGSRTFLGQGISVWDASARTPYNLQWNFDLQQTLPGELLVDLAYAGNHGVRLNQNREFNALDPRYYSLGTALQTLVNNPFYPNIPVGALAQRTVQQRQLLLPYPQYTGVGFINSSSGNSIYHSMALKVEKRVTRGLGFLMSYTFGKLISDVRNSITSNDNNLNSGLNTSVQDWYNLRAERALSEMDVAQSFVLSYVYELPFGKGQRFGAGAPGALNSFIGGWQFSGVTTFRSGFPLTMSAPIPGGGTRPNSTGVSGAITSDRSRDDQIRQWFDTAQYLLPASFTNGNVGRTVPDVRSPAFTNWDVSLVKNALLAEKVNLQFRFESFNLPNAVRLWLPNTGRGNVQFGQITSTTGLPRVNQFALKLIF